MHDLKLMVDNTSPPVQVKAAGHSGALEVVLELRKLGVSRTGTAQTEQLYNDALEYFERQ